MRAPEQVRAVVAAALLVGPGHAEALRERADRERRAAVQAEERGRFERHPGLREAALLVEVRIAGVDEGLTRDDDVPLDARVRDRELELAGRSRRDSDVVPLVGAEAHDSRRAVELRAGVTARFGADADAHRRAQEAAQRVRPTAVVRRRFRSPDGAHDVRFGAEVDRRGIEPDRDRLSPVALGGRRAVHRRREDALDFDVLRGERLFSGRRGGLCRALGVGRSGGFRRRRRHGSVGRGRGRRAGLGRGGGNRFRRRGLLRERGRRRERERKRDQTQ